MFPAISINTKNFLNIGKIHTNRIISRFKSIGGNNTKEGFSAQYCANLVKQSDYENFLCTLLLDGEKRRAAFAVRALNVEIAKVGSSISEQTIGKMRLQFWNDSIEKCFAAQTSYVTDQPVLKELKMVVDKHKLTKTYLKRLIKARDRPLNLSFLTVKEMEDYAEQTVSSLYYLLLEVWGVKNMNVDHAASHLGKAQGISNLLRSIPQKGRSTTVCVPQEVLMKHGVSQERILRDKVNDKGVEECIFEIASVAHQHLEKSRNLSSQVPKEIRPILLPAVAVDRFLNRLRRVNFKLSDSNIIRRDQMLPIAYYWNKLRSKY